LYRRTTYGTHCLPKFQTGRTRSSSDETIKRKRYEKQKTESYQNKKDLVREGEVSQWRVYGNVSGRFKKAHHQTNKLQRGGGDELPMGGSRTKEFGGNWFVTNWRIVSGILANRNGEALRKKKIR